MIEQIHALVVRELKRFYRDKSRAFSMLTMPLLWLTLFGLGLKNVIQFPGLTTAYDVFVLPGIIGMIILFGGMFNGVRTIIDKKSGFMKEMLISPTPKTIIVIGKGLGVSIIITIQSLIILLASKVIIPVNLLHLPLTIIIIFLTSYVFTMLGLLLATLTESFEGFHALINLITMPMFLFSGAFYPLQNVPKWLELLTRVNPLTYAIKLLREALLNNEINITALTIIITIMIVVTIITAKTYNKKE